MQVGTLSGNPVAATAGLKTLEILSRDGQFERLYALGQGLKAALSGALAKQGIPHQIVGEDCLFDVVFSDRPVRDYRDVMASRTDRQKAFNASLRGSGILKSAAKIYPHLALAPEDLEQTYAAFDKAAASLLE